MYDDIIFANFIVTTRCTSKCKWCAYWRIPNQDLSFNNFKYIVKNLSKENLEGMLLTGGEPLLHPQIHNFIHLLKSYEIPIIMNTNGWFFNRLSDHDLKMFSTIIISIDSPNPESYRSIRGSYLLQNIIDSIKRISKVTPETTITLSGLIQKENIYQINDIINFALKLKANALSLLVPSYEPFGFGWGVVKKQPPLEKLRLDEIESLKHTFETITKSPELVELINQPPIVLRDYLEYFKKISGFESYIPIRDCLVPYQTITITVKGTMKPCFYLPYEFEVNYNEDVILSKEREIFLKKFAINRLQEKVCKNCMQFLCNEDIRPVI